MHKNIFLFLVTISSLSLCAQNAQPTQEISRKIKSLEDRTKAVRTPALPHYASTPSIVEKVLRSLHYGALGDALGNPFEFATKADRNAPFNGSTLTRITSTQDIQQLAYAHHPPHTDCLVTDDTVMGELTFAVLAKNKNRKVFNRKKEPSDRLLLELLAERYIANYKDKSGYSWADSYRAPGKACLTTIKKLSTLAYLKKRFFHSWWASSSGYAPGTEGGCGAIMRAAPAGWVFHDDITRAARVAGLQSLITHGDGCSIAASAAFAAAIAAGIQGYSIEHIFDIAESAARTFNGGTESEKGDWQKSPFKTKHALIADEIRSCAKAKIETLQELEQWYRDHSSFGAPGFLTGALATLKFLEKNPTTYTLLEATLFPVNAPQNQTVIDRDSLASGIGQLVSVVDELNFKKEAISPLIHVERSKERDHNSRELCALIAKHDGNKKNSYR